jgi:hypothetical protein
MIAKKPNNHIDPALNSIILNRCLWTFFKVYISDFGLEIVNKSPFIFQKQIKKSLNID